MWYGYQSFLRAMSLTKEQFIRIRHRLEKTQKQLASLLSISLKAVQSFEQGWRVIPAHVERQMLFLLAMKRGGPKKPPPCWEMKKCLPEHREDCPAWEFQSGHLCWFINGTICQGQDKKSWREKIKTCRGCEVLKAVLAE
jgi:hypothetical protein